MNEGPIVPSFLIKSYTKMSKIITKINELTESSSILIIGKGKTVGKAISISEILVNEYPRWEKGAIEIFSENDEGYFTGCSFLLIGTRKNTSCISIKLMQVNEAVTDDVELPKNKKIEAERSGL